MTLPRCEGACQGHRGAIRVAAAKIPLDLLVPGVGERSEAGRASKAYIICFNLVSRSLQLSYVDSLQIYR